MNDSLQNTPGDLDEIKARIEAMEETVETVCRPVADVFSQERIHAIERASYEAQLKIEALEKQILRIARRRKRSPGNRVGSSPDLQLRSEQPDMAGISESEWLSAAGQRPAGLMETVRRSGASRLVLHEPSADHLIDRRLPRMAC